MMRLTADLLDVSSISRGQLRLPGERIDLRVCSTAIGTMDSELQRLGHRLVITLPDAPVSLHADATRL